MKRFFFSSPKHFHTVSVRGLTAIVGEFEPTLTDFRLRNANRPFKMGFVMCYICGRYILILKRVLILVSIY